MSLLVVGALHWDVVVEAGRLPRIGETLRGREVRYRLGGKGGNQAIAAARAGAKVAFAGRIGSDAPGQTMARVLSEAGVDTSLLQWGSGQSGMSAAITVEGGDYGAVIVSGENHAFDAAALPIPTGCRIVTAQNEMAPGLLEQLSKAARDSGAEFWVNLAPVGDVTIDDLRGLSDVLIVNRLEACDLIGPAAKGLSGASLAERICEALTSTEVIVTLGENGVAHAGNGAAAAVSVQDAPKVDVVSTHGAGDVFCGMLAAARLDGEDWASAIKAAQIAASDHVAQIR